MPYKIVFKQQHHCMYRQHQASLQLKWRPVLMQTDMRTGKFMDPFKVEKGRLRELSWANKHTTHELAKDQSARSWLHDI